MDKYEKMKSEIIGLTEIGRKLYKSLVRDKNGEYTDYYYFLMNYESWYTQSLRIITVFSPERKDDFSGLYSNKRKSLSLETYSISDALNSIEDKLGSFGPWIAISAIIRQNEMLKACLKSFESTVWNIQTVLQADIFDSEIDSASHLLKMGFLRAAGAVCGVIIEKHLKMVCGSRGIQLSRKNPSIADYNDLLKDNAYDTIEWRKIQRLGDIRNLCDHSKEREPTKDEVEELISGTEHVIKTVF